jgi:peptidoglycan-N-acetylglucosamine deacetylase
LFDAAAVAFSLLVIFFIYSALRSEPLPDLSWLTEKKPYHALKEERKERRRARSAAWPRSPAPDIAILGPQSSFATDAELRARGAGRILRFLGCGQLLFVARVCAPDRLALSDVAAGARPDGHLQASDPETNAMFDVVQGQTVHPVDDKVMPFLKAEDTEMEVFPVVQNFDGTDFVPGRRFPEQSGGAGQFSTRDRDFFLPPIIIAADDRFRILPQEGAAGYVDLLNELSSDLHAKGMKLYVSVQVRNEDFDYKAISAAVDGVVIMNYDEHFPGGTPGPVASQDWFTDNLDSAVEGDSEREADLRYRQLRLRLGREAEKGQAASGRGRQERFRAGGLDRGARFRRRR